MVPRAASGEATATAVLGPTRRDLEDELTAVLGARHEARFIVDEVVGTGADTSSRGAPSLGAQALAPEAVASARAMAGRRAAGEPLQYVFGHWSFRHLNLLVDRRVLIPRPETEQVVEVALREARRLHGAVVDPAAAGRLIAVDAGTGTGAIALSLAAELGAALSEVWAVDASSDALVVAAANLDAVRRRDQTLPSVALAHGDWLAPLPVRLRGAVDLVVSNPPYVSEDEWAALDPLVGAEPRRALVSGPGGDGTAGLAGVEAVLVESLAWLRRPGAVVVELAPHQAPAAARLARSIGYAEVRVVPDLAGRDRALVARLDAPA
jgi:release factor glutamine methyltransferase